jgi:hypothetical protein
MYTNTALQQPPVKLFNMGSVPSSSTKLPAAPFLVPAIMEALSRCKRYEGLVEVVPGEADLYCANHVSSHGGVVLTGDSDLLIHEIGDGAVGFFKDIQLAVLGDKTSLIGIQYQVGAIVQRLGLSETYRLAALAFEMTMDAHGTFQELLQKAVKLNAVSTQDAMFQEFMSDYKALESTRDLKETGNSENAVHSPSPTRNLKMLDPRVSEYLLQFPKFAQAAGLPRSRSSDSIDLADEIDVFLPFLLDCPLRTSAWEMSTAVRLLAYGAVNMILPHQDNVLKVIEYRRLQNGSRGRKWQIPMVQDLPKACTDLNELFKKLRNDPATLPGRDIWRALAIYQDQDLSLSLGKPALSSIIIEQSKNSRASPFRLTWDGIHLLAQFHGSYYSFRILKQILGIILLYYEPKDLPLALLQLHEELESLPTLEELPTIVDAVRNIGSPEDQAVLEMIKKLLGIQVVVESRKAPGRKVGKKRKTGGATEDSKPPEQSKYTEESNCREESNTRQRRSNNIFELLNAE